VQSQVNSGHIYYSEGSVAAVDELRLEWSRAVPTSTPEEPFVGSSDELAVDERRAGAHERDQLQCVARATGLGHLDEYERHRRLHRA